MTQQQAKRLKKTPCNGCRERKRKCTYEQPCARCLSFGLDCEYTILTSPKDLEYLQELDYMNQVELMQTQITRMENEIAAIRLAQLQQAKASLLKDYPSPVSVNEDVVVVVGNNKNNNKKKTKGRHSLLFTQDYQAEISKPSDVTQPWVVTVKNGQMMIDTHIQSHTQLLSSIGSMINTAIYQKNTNQLPFPLFTTLRRPPEDDMVAIMCIMAWKKYGKTRYKTYTKYTPRLLKHLSSSDLSPLVPVEGLTSITLGLISTYMQCGHYIQLAIYMPAFSRLFLSGNVLTSPAALALCSVICCQSCQHLLNVLPIDALPEYSVYYFEQARDLIADRFDHADLEALVTYACLAVCKLKQGCPDEAGSYLVMAERVHAVLKPQYAECTSDEAVLFRRFYKFVWHARSVYDLHMCMKVSTGRPHIAPTRLDELLDDSHLPIVMGPHDTDKEKKYILMKQLVAELRRVIREGGRLAVAQDYPTYVSIFSHHIEMGLHHWYKHVIPPAFRLSLPLFDDRIDDLAFFTALERDCADTPIAAMTTVSAYNEYLIVAKSYVPKEPKETRLDTEALIRRYREIQDSMHNNHSLKPDAEVDPKAYHWIKLVNKMRHFRSQNHHNTATDDKDEESEEAYFTRFIRALNPSNMKFDMLVTHTAIKAALNVVRISQFMLSKDFACFFDVKSLFNAWDLLLRAARFKYQQPYDPNPTIDRIRANLIVCLDIVKAYLAYSSRIPNPPLLTEMQKEFDALSQE